MPGVIPFDVFVKEFVESRLTFSSNVSRDTKSSIRSAKVSEVLQNGSPMLQPYMYGGLSSANIGWQLTVSKRKSTKALRANLDVASMWNTMQPVSLYQRGTRIDKYRWRFIASLHTRPELGVPCRLFIYP